MEIKRVAVVFGLILILMMGTLVTGKGPDMSYKYIDLRLHCNMGFKDNIPDNDEGGWTDDGPTNDFRDFPTGVQYFNGIPFEIINPDLNNGKSCIVLKSKAKPYFPESATNIEVGYPVEKLHFIHAMTWAVERPGEYNIHFTDGTTMNIPLENKHNIYNWWFPKGLDLGDAKVAWTGSTPKHTPIGVCHYTWINPHPEKVVKSFDVVSFYTDGAPILVAVTAEVIKPKADIEMRGEKINVTKGEDIILNLSISNPVVDQIMTAKVYITPPTRWNISTNSSKFVKSGAEQYMAPYTFEPGETKNIEIRIESKKVGVFEVKGFVVSQFGYIETEEVQSQAFSPITVTVEKPEAEPGFEAVFAISGFLAVAYVVIRRKRV